MTNSTARVEAFEKWVKNKFNIYNSLFLNQRADSFKHVGMLIPLLYESSKLGLEAGQYPIEILDTFFENQAGIQSETAKINFMFKVIQFVERQVVLFDSVEDASFEQIQRHASELSLKEYFALHNTKNKGPEFEEQLKIFKARLVLTAHPTQFYPRSVLDIISSLRKLISKNNINDIDLVLQQLGMTSLLNSKKPTPYEEAQNLIYYLKYVYYDAIGELYSNIKKNIASKEFDNPELIQLGFWPGGDRDGNPYVTHKATMLVADDLRMSLMKCYYWDVKRLSLMLTFKDVSELILNLKQKLYQAMYESERAIPFTEILEPLTKARARIIKCYNSLYIDELDKVIDKVKIFKTHFATLDIRQNHDVHKKTIEAILRSEKLIESSLDELEEPELVNILTSKNILIDVTKFKDPLIKDTLQTISGLKLIQTKNGEAGCNRYIISNAEDIYAVLFVYALFRWCGLRDSQLTFDIIPLFESMDGMTHSAYIIETLFNNNEYRKHVALRNNTQTVMLGFSDGTKDGGYLQANWSIFKTKESISAVCAQHHIKAVFFDGRGGPPARGGGKTHRFYASQSKEIAKHEIQLTIQGQTITSRYGTKAHFTHNCEQLLTAGLSNIISDKENHINVDDRRMLEELAVLSHQKYTRLKQHEMFLPYLENKSTLKYYAEANIGSRPVKRGNDKKLELKDLRAIPFVGSWSQMKQNVPGYFGVGTALKELEKQGKLDELKHLFRDVPYFKTLMLNSMMSLFKCDFNLTRYISKDDNYKEFWHILLDEYQLSKDMLLLISGFDHLMQEEAVSKESIEIRKRIVLPLLVIQQYAMQKIEQGVVLKPSYEKIVKRSLYGNINASRNSV
ncbi:MAG: phosphoenolpyruvate carboxylase [Candidatus Marinimicrobia bacterium]|nr:phosphoenolpyruvate carboxylase [Candidatus Neomarinimicrobiota bacterium]MCF7921468.1 phosphoenolpyruvate carboxylase [Candidatus Neomarinimicrobiota bacterium]